MEVINGRESRSRFALPLLRVAPRGVARVTWQTADAVKINTHWLGRRLWCCEEDCPGCQFAEIRTVVYGVVLWESDHGAKALLLETSPQEMSRLQGFCEMEGLEIAPGLVFEASRRRERSPLRLEPVSMEGRVIDDLTPARRALAAAAVLAGVSPPRAEPSMPHYVGRIRTQLRSQLEQAVAKRG